MASIGHIAVGLCAGRLFDGRKRSMLLFAVLSLLPDADALGHALGVPYGAVWGHRGATHSLAFAAALAGFTSVLLRRRRWRTFLFALVVVASHGVLDAFTDGGRGVALLWPFSNERYFAPFRPIRVAPLGLRFFSMRGLHVALTETVLFLPFFVYALMPGRRRSA